MKGLRVRVNNALYKCEIGRIIQLYPLKPLRECRKVCNQENFYTECLGTIYWRVRIRVRVGFKIMWRKQNLRCEFSIQPLDWNTYLCISEMIGLFVNRHMLERALPRARASPCTHTHKLLLYIFLDTLYLSTSLSLYTHYLSFSLDIHSFYLSFPLHILFMSLVKHTLYVSFSLYKQNHSLYLSGSNISRSCWVYVKGIQSPNKNKLAL